MIAEISYRQPERQACLTKAAHHPNFAMQSSSSSLARSRQRNPMLAKSFFTREIQVMFRIQGPTGRAASISLRATSCSHIFEPSTANDCAALHSQVTARCRKCTCIGDQMFEPVRSRTNSSFLITCLCSCHRPGITGTCWPATLCSRLL